MLKVYDRNVTKTEELRKTVIYSQQESHFIYTHATIMLLSYGLLTNENNLKEQRQYVSSSCVLSVHYRCYYTEPVVIDEYNIFYIKRLEFVR